MPFFGGGQGEYHIVVTNIKGGTNAAPAVIGDNNMALGNAALQNAENADANIAVGNNALVLNVTGSNNVSIGANSGANISSGSNNIFIGFGADSEGEMPGILTDGVVVGTNADLFDNQGVVIGSGGNVAGGVAVGYATTGSSGVAVGNSATASGNGVISDVAIGTGATADNGGIAIGDGATALNGEIIIGQGTETDVQVGAYVLNNVPAPGDPNFWTTDYLAVGQNDNTAVINGSNVSARLALWVDDGGTDMAGMGIGKADSTAANAGSTIYLARSRGTLATPLNAINGDLLGGIIALGYDGTDMAVSSRIDFEVDGGSGANDMPGRIVFKTSPDGSQAPAEAMRISQNKTVAPAALLDISGATAGQIKFPAVQNPSADVYTLDDYREADFTPVFSSAIPGDLTVTYTLQYGNLTKIGNRVFFDISINCTPTFSTAAGAVIVSGLSIAAASSVTNYRCDASITPWIAPAGYYFQSSAAINNTQTMMFQRHSNAGLASDNIAITEFTSGVPIAIRVSGVYRSA